MRNFNQIMRSYENEGWGLTYYNNSGTTSGTTIMIKTASRGDEIHYITDIHYFNDFGGKVSILNGTAFLFSAFTPNNQFFLHEFKTPLKSSAGASISLQSESSGVLTVISMFLGGYKRK